MNAAELSMLLAGRALDVAGHLLPHGKRKGAELKAGNTSGEPGDSLSVRVTGAKAGVWKDFASGEGGDLIDLWMACRGQSMSEALKDIKAYLGVRDESPRPPERVYTRPEKPRCHKPKGRVAEWLQGRGLTPPTLEAFRIAEQVRGEKVYAVFPFLDEAGELINVKYRNPDEKKDMVIAVAATVGASFSVARRDKSTRLGAIWFFAKLVILAVLVTVGLAAIATAYYPTLHERSLLAPIALLVGFVGDGWPALLGKVMKFLGGLLDLARGKGGVS